MVERGTENPCVGGSIPPPAIFLLGQSMKLAIGIDIGGTKISLALGNARGKILLKRVIPTRIQSKAKSSFLELLSGVKDLSRAAKRHNGKVIGVGVGIPGPVDSAKGVIPKSPNLPGWEGISITKALQKVIKVPVVLANDANIGAVGEKVFGQGRDCQNLIYITVSTGIGGGLIVGGKLLEGASGVAGEVGHMKVRPDGNRCGCGRYGCLEAEASGTAIANKAKRLIRSGKNLGIKNKSINQITAKDVGEAAARGNRVALGIYEEAGYCLGIGLANLLNSLNPEKIILGGGVLNSAPPVFWRTAVKTYRKEAWPEAVQAVSVVHSKLRNHIADLGALALAFYPDLIS